MCSPNLVACLMGLDNGGGNGEGSGSTVEQKAGDCSGPKSVAPAARLWRLHASQMEPTPLLQQTVLPVPSLSSKT